MAKDSLRLKFHQLVSKKSETGLHAPSRNEEFSPDTIKEFSQGIPQEMRLRVLQDLIPVVLEQKIPDRSVAAVWLGMWDLIGGEQTPDTRHSALSFLTAMVKGQRDHLGHLSLHFFRVATARENFLQDMAQRLELLKEVTNDGRTIVFFENELSQFIITLLPSIMHSEKFFGFLQWLARVVQFNAAAMEDHVITALVETAAVICSQQRPMESMEVCLHLLECILRSRSLRSHSLGHFVVTLCNTVNQEALCYMSWELTRKLLGTHMGHHSVYQLCLLLQSPDHKQQPGLLRGAVFFVSMALWGSKNIPSLRNSFVAVLPFFLQVLSCNHQLVAHELSLSMSRLVKKYGPQLHLVAWEMVLDILEIISRQSLQFDARVKLEVADRITDTLTTIEELYENKTFTGSPEKFFALLQSWLHIRPESSSELYIKFHAESIHPATSNWIEKLQAMLDRFFREDTRDKVRLYMLQVLFSVLHNWLDVYQEELMEQVVLPHLHSVAHDPSDVVRNASAQMLADFAQNCRTHHFMSIADILFKVATRSMDLPPNTTQMEEERCLQDVKTAVLGLVDIFKHKLFHVPSSHASYAFQLLLEHMKQQYENSYKSHLAAVLRIGVFDCLLQLRVNSHLRLGLQTKSTCKVYSPYIYCDGRDLLHTQSPLAEQEPTIPCSSHMKTTLHFMDVIQLVERCIQQETSWEVLVVVLSRLETLLHHRLLILATDTDLNSLCCLLCDLVSDPMRLRVLKDVPPQNMRSDLHQHVYPVLTAIVPYCHKLRKDTQLSLVQCLQDGLAGKRCKSCVVALTLGIMEMQRAMVKMLPMIVRRMAKISTTPLLAAPVLEFLSTLVRMSNLYTNFVEMHYRSVFGTILPYTDPSKYSVYIVTFAHHVLAMWFIRCRTPLRKLFVPFIVKHLNITTSQLQRAIMAAQAGDGAAASDACAGMNMADSPGSRPRSMSDGSSLRSPSGETSTQGARLQESLHLHQELSEACLDMMIRFTNTACSTLHSWSPGASHLLSGGVSQSWLIGHTIITITTGLGTDGDLSSLSVPPAPIQSTNSATKLPSAVQEKSGVTTPDSCGDPLASYAALRSAGWAAIDVKRPCGNTAWMMRLQNRLAIMASPVVSSLVANEPSLRAMYSNDDAEESELASLFTGNVSPADQLDTQRKETAPVSLAAAMRAVFGNADMQDARGLSRSSTVTLGDNAGEMPDAEADTECSLHSRPGDVGSVQNNDESPAMMAAQLASSSQLRIDSQSHAVVCSKSLDGPAESGQRKGLLAVLKSSASDHDFTTSYDSTGSHSARLEHSVSGSDIAQRYELSKSRSASVEPSASAHDLPKSFSTTAELSASGNDPTKTRSAMVELSSGGCEGPRAPRPSLSDICTSPPHTISGLSVGPSFVFLQLFHTGLLEHIQGVPILLPNAEGVKRSLRILDLIPAYETHKIGVIYVDKGQKDAATILGNTHGCARYERFLDGLGEWLTLADCDPTQIYLGGLSGGGEDGQWAISWQDDIAQVIFHVATLMPNRTSDPACTSKIKHIGNNFVQIVYNNSESDFQMGSVVKGHFNFTTIVIRPLPLGVNEVSVQYKEGVESVMVKYDVFVISDKWLPVLVRQTALHANLACQIHHSRKNHIGEAYASNWVQRLRQMKRIREKISPERRNGDFTDFS